MSGSPPIFHGQGQKVVVPDAKGRPSSEKDADLYGVPISDNGALNFLKEIWRTAAIAYPLATWRQRYHRLKYAVRSLALFKSTKTWLAMLAGSKFQPFLRHSPRLYLKLQRPLLIKGLPARRKLQLLQSHYQFLFQTFPVPILERICSPLGVALCELNPKTNFCFKLSLRASLQEREGETTLVLEDVQSKSVIQYLTFSILLSDRMEKEFLIGGIQGVRSQSGKQLVVETTRACLGLRPKSLLLFALQQLARLWNVREIKAVGNLQHVCHKKLKKIGSNSDFDAFWIESGGVPACGGIFLLPLTHQEKDLSDLAASKRAMYRKRYSMLKSIAHDIQTGLTLLTEGNNGLR